MKKALVFGGNGFLGQFVVKELCEQNFEVLIASRTKGNFDIIKTFGFPGQVNITFFDANKINSLEDFNLQNFDVVINLIGIGMESKKQPYHIIHKEFPARLASFTKKFGVRFLHISAFTGTSEIPSKYVKTKRDGEIAIMNNNPKATIIRPSVMIGEGGALVQTFEKMVNSFPFLPLANGKKAKVQPVFAGDVAKFIITAMERDETQGKGFNLCGEEVILMEEFVQRICGFMNKKKIILNLPFAILNLAFKVLGILPKFIFRTSLTADILALSNYDIFIERNDLKKFVEKPQKIDDVLEKLLEKYKLYD